MKRLLPALLLIASSSFAQDSTWRKIEFDKHLSLLLPGETEKTDTTMMSNGKPNHVYMMGAATDHVSLNVTAIENPGYIDPNNSKDHNEVYEGIRKSFAKSLQGRATGLSMADTVLDHINGIAAKMQVNGIETRNYLFVLGNNTYNITIYLPQGTTTSSQQEMSKLLNSIRFTVEVPGEVKKKIEREINWEKLGELIGTLVFVAVIVFGFLYSSKKKKSKPNSNIS